MILLKAERVQELEEDSAGEARKQFPLALLLLLQLLGELKGRGVSGCIALAAWQMALFEFLTRSKRSGELLASLMAWPCFAMLSVGVSFDGAMLTSGGVGVDAADAVTVAGHPGDERDFNKDNRTNQSLAIIPT